MDSQQQPSTPPPADSAVVSPNPGKSKKKLVLVAVAVVLLVVVAGVLSMGGNKKTTTSSGYDPENHKYEGVVSITEDGFVPATMTVRPQTEVFFENHTTNPNEPDEAANPVRVVQSKAATQEQYFETNPIAVKSGYGHTFNNPGTYQFYDAAVPTHSVTIIVSKS